MFSCLRLFVVVAYAILLLARPAAAATATTTFQVQITINDDCNINSATNIDFGVNGVLDANADATGTIAIQCTLQSPFTIGLDAGTGSGATVAVRKLTGPASNTVTYSLYQDVGHLQVWGNTIGTNTVAGTGTGNAVNFTVYGRVPPQSTPSSGLYTDTITVTITF
jgi:spore coat protein U-like protein